MSLLHPDYVEGLLRASFAVLEREKDGPHPAVPNSALVSVNAVTLAEGRMMVLMMDRNRRETAAHVIVGR
jgi:hypothetical protein